MYNATSNSWTTYPTGLGQARHSLAAASLASGLVFFAGGFEGACLLCCCDARSLWSFGGSTAGGLAMLRDADAVALMWRSLQCTDAFTLGGAYSSYVDMYNATSNSWTTYPAGLGQMRNYLAGASLASGLVFFAGGFEGAA